MFLSCSANCSSDGNTLRDKASCANSLKKLLTQNSFSPCKPGFPNSVFLFVCTCFRSQFYVCKLSYMFDVCLVTCHVQTFAFCLEILKCGVDCTRGTLASLMTLQFNNVIYISLALPANSSKGTVFMAQVPSRQKENFVHLTTAVLSLYSF